MPILKDLLFDMVMTAQDPRPTGVGIFAKAPVAGLAKTRLIPRLGAQGAAELQRRLIERTVRLAYQAKIGPVSLWCTPDRNHAVFKQMRADFGVTLYDQSGDDLGGRMQHALSNLCASGPALLLGCDCVVMTSAILVECAGLLREQRDAVIVPVEDGGYIAIGLNRPQPLLFDAMPWGTSSVMPETRRRSFSMGLRVAELPVLWDIDQPEDYDRAVRRNLL